MVRIMIVDDNPSIRWIFTKMLEKAGYSIITAKDGEECLHNIEMKFQRPDVILLDIMMPGLDGWEVCKRIKEDESTRDIIVIMVSVKAEDEDIKKSIEYAHADEHVDKLDSHDILKVIETQLTRATKNDV